MTWIIIGIVVYAIAVLGVVALLKSSDREQRIRLVPDEPRRGWPRRIPSPGPHSERSDGRSGDGVRRDESRHRTIDAARLVHFS